jgi:diacylglycerol kinase family enzyme
VAAGLLIVNPRAGSRRPDADELAAEARRRGIEVHVLRPGDDPAVIARAADAGALGIAGGDGSLAQVAEVALDLGCPFVCVPFGTRNHFARDAGLDRDDVLAALDAFEDGRELSVDVGRVNGRVFLNNVSLGVYARLVHHRERRRRRREALARVRALTLLLTDRQPVRLQLEGEEVRARVVLVANNAYALDLFSGRSARALRLGERDRLDEGLLHVYMSESLLPHEWLDRTCERLTIESARPRIRAAIDGEPAELRSPIELAIEPRALRLLLPGRR